MRRRRPLLGRRHPQPGCGFRDLDRAATTHCHRCHQERRDNVGGTAHPTGRNGCVERHLVRRQGDLHGGRHHQRHSHRRLGPRDEGRRQGLDLGGLTVGCGLRRRRPMLFHLELCGSRHRWQPLLACRHLRRWPSLATGRFAAAPVSREREDSPAQPSRTAWWPVTRRPVRDTPTALLR